MGRTLLIGHPAASWREWEKEHRGGRDWICLDPSDANHGTPARFTLWRGDKPVAWRFYGSLDARRFPQVVLAALAELLAVASSDVAVQLYSYEPSPVLRHLALLAAQGSQPDEILVAKGTTIDLGGWPVGPEEIELEAALPIMVQGAQRKAHWLKLIEACEVHDVDLRQTSVEGARLGSGKAMSPGQIEKAGLDGLSYGEVCGATLMLVSDGQIDDDALSRCLAVMHCARAHIVSPTDYGNLLCSFARQNGDDFGMGLIQRIDFAARVAHVLCTAVPPAPARILRVGAMRIDLQGRELGEVRPWQV